MFEFNDGKFQYGFVNILHITTYAEMNGLWHTVQLMQNSFFFIEHWKVILLVICVYFTVLKIYVYLIF